MGSGGSMMRNTANLLPVYTNYRIKDITTMSCSITVFPYQACAASMLSIESVQVPTRSGDVMLTQGGFSHEESKPTAWPLSSRRLGKQSAHFLRPDPRVLAMAKQER